jgi:endo-1,4-beta-xylanase
MMGEPTSPGRWRLRRRELLKLGGAAALGAVASLESGPAGAQSAVTALKDAAGSRGLRYGSDSDSTIGFAPQPYRDLFASHCALYAANLSWASVTPLPGTPDPAREDPNLPFIYANGMAITGAHLIWHAQMPAWVKAITDPQSFKRAIIAHIGAMATHYAGKVFSWNVVNEALDPPEGRPDGLRNAPILAVLGPKYLDYCFRIARRAMPKTLLVYNDYNMEMDRPDHEARRRALIGLLDAFKLNNSPVDTIGLQSHLRLDGSVFNESLYRAFLKEIASRGYKIMITELDVLDLATPSDIALRDQAVADMYRRFLAVALDEPAVKSVVTWGLSDRYTWLTASRSAQYARADGMPARPLPFDDFFQPKPAYDALLTALKNAPLRTPA